MSDDPPRRFSWAREWRWLGVPIAISLLVRGLAIPHILTYFHSDSAIGALMAKHIGQGQRLPIFYYGQAYVGSLELIWAAPWQAAWPADPRALGWALAVGFSLGLAAIYRLGWELGGRAGALIASCWLAIGTPWVVMLTAGRQFSYGSTLLLGVVLLLVGRRLGEDPSRRRVGGFFFLLGLGLWNNPQIIQFALPPLAAWWCAGAFTQARREGTVCADLGGACKPLAALAGLALLGLVGSLALGLLEPLIGRIDRDGGYPISLGRPGRYLLLSGAALAGLALLAELLTARARDAGAWGRWLRTGALAGGALAVGMAPSLLAPLLTELEGNAAPTKIDPALVYTNGPRLLHEGRAIALGQQTHASGVSSEARLWLGRGRWLGLGLIGLLALATLIAHRRQLWALITLRAERIELPLQLLLQALLLLALYLLKEGTAKRYLLHLWPAMVGLAAWAAGRLGRVGRAALAALLLAAYLPAMAAWLGWHLPRIAPPHLREVVRDLQQRGASHGRASYFVAYKISFLSDERVQFASFQSDRMAWVRAEVEGARETFILVMDYLPRDVRARDHQLDVEELRRRLGRRAPRERWRIGPYLSFR